MKKKMVIKKTLFFTLAIVMVLLTVISASAANYNIPIMDDATTATRGNWGYWSSNRRGVGQSFVPLDNYPIHNITIYGCTLGGNTFVTNFTLHNGSSETGTVIETKTATISTTGSVNVVLDFNTALAPGENYFLEVIPQDFSSLLAGDRVDCYDAGGTNYVNGSERWYYYPSGGGWAGVPGTADLSSTIYFSSVTPPTPGNNFTVSVVDSWDSSPVNDVVVVVDGITYTNATGNTVTTIIYDNDTALYDIDVNATGYYNYTKNDYNISISGNLQQSLNASYISFRAFAFLSGYELSPANFTINDTTKGVNESFNIKPGSYNVTFSKDGYSNSTLSIIVNNLNNATYNFTNMSRGNITIYSYDPIKKEQINIFNITIDSPYYDSYSTNTGSISVYSTDIYVNISFNATGYNDNTFAYYLNQSINQSLYTYNTLNISFYDEVTGVLINNRNISLEVISDIYANNYSISSGSINISFLTPVEYNLRYYATGYNIGTYYFEIEDNSYNYLNLTLLNSSGTTNITISVVDQYTDPLEGARVKVLRYRVASNSYELVSTRETNFEGEVYVPVTLYTEFYKFIVEYKEEAVLSTNPSYLTKTSITLQAIVGIDAGDSVDYYQSLDYSLSYNDTSGNAKLTYNDPSGLGTYVCLRARTNTNGFLSETCSSGSAATLLLGLAPLSNDTVYYVEAFYRYDGEMVLMQQLLVIGDSTSGTIPNTLVQGLFLQLLLTLVVVAVTIWSPPILMVAAPLSLIAGRALGFTTIPYEFMLPLVFVGLILAFVLGRRA